MRAAIGRLLLWFIEAEQARRRRVTAQQVNIDLLPSNPWSENVDAAFDQIRRKSSAIVSVSVRKETEDA